MIDYKNGNVPEENVLSTILRGMAREAQDGTLGKSQAERKYDVDFYHGGEAVARLTANGMTKDDAVEKVYGNPVYGIASIPLGCGHDGCEYTFAVGSLIRYHGFEWDVLSFGKRDGVMLANLENRSCVSDKRIYTEVSNLEPPIGSKRFLCRHRDEMDE